MPKMHVTDLGRQRLYLTRHMWSSEDEAYIEPQCVEAAKALGYVEDITPETAPPPTRRGRPPKRAAAAAAPAQAGKHIIMTTHSSALVGGTGNVENVEGDLKEQTRADLIKMAEERGVELPSGYVDKDTLVDLVGSADDDDDDGA